MIQGKRQHVGIATHSDFQSDEGEAQGSTKRAKYTWSSRGESTRSRACHPECRAWINALEDREGITMTCQRCREMTRRGGFCYNESCISSWRECLECGEVRNRGEGGLCIDWECPQFRRVSTCLTVLLWRDTQIELLKLFYEI